MTAVLDVVGRLPEAVEKGLNGPCNGEYCAFFINLVGSCPCIYEFGGWVFSPSPASRQLLQNAFVMCGCCNEKCRRTVQRKQLRRAMSSPLCSKIYL